MSDDISRKIRALKAKTVDAGCTEQEAMMAAEKVRELMAEHNLSSTQVDTVTLTSKIRGLSSTNLNNLICGIEKATNTSTLFSRSSVTFYGQPHHVEIAEYLLHLAISIVKSEFRKFKRATDISSYD